jgi:hypothetical protein
MLLLLLHRPARSGGVPGSSRLARRLPARISRRAPAQLVAILRRPASLAASLGWKTWDVGGSEGCQGVSHQATGSTELVVRAPSADRPTIYLLGEPSWLPCDISVSRELTRGLSLPCLQFPVGRSYSFSRLSSRPNRAP